MSAQRATRASRRISARALTLIRSSINEYVVTASNSSARRMAKGSDLDGRAMNVAQTTASHAVSYKITSYYSSPPGNAVELTIGALMGFLLERSSRLRPVPTRRLEKSIRLIRKRLRFRSGTSGITEFREILKRLGLVETLKEAGLSDEGDLMLIADSVNHE